MYKLNAYFIISSKIMTALLLLLFFDYINELKTFFHNIWNFRQYNIILLYYGRYVVYIYGITCLFAIHML